MNFLSILCIAVALAADAFAVSLATGISRQRVGLPLMLRMACVFGGFQFFMPVLGWIMGAQALTLIGGVDHWVAFGLLAFVGVKMIREGLSGRDKAVGSKVLSDPVPGGRADTSNPASASRIDVRDPAPEGRAGAPDPASAGGLLLLGVATSLDALAVGLSLAVLRADIWFPAAVIGIVCFFFTCAGVSIGSRLRCMPGFRSLGGGANILGGLVLLAVGIKILYEHGVFGN
ncbi:MAG: manganese efflux pump MntP family protein [Desulfovibrio sp.]|jgi:putative Mn2+ efflux pump MntP|nr:manganese efflux pump MntP family protein [Desulfovibrio sp.]